MVRPHLPAKGIVSASDPGLPHAQRSHGAGEIRVAVTVHAHQPHSAGEEPVVLLVLGKQPLQPASHDADVCVAESDTAALVGAVGRVPEEGDVIVQTLAVAQAHYGIRFVFFVSDQILVAPPAS